MRESECMEQVVRLVEGFPGTKATDGNARAYCEALIDLRYPEALRDAVTELIRTHGSPFIPPIALVREEYLRHRDKYLPPALPEPEMSEEEQAENARRARQMLNRLGGDLDEP